MCASLIKLPKGMNPHGFITVRKAAEVTGIPIKTIYTWKDRPEFYFFEGTAAAGIPLNDEKFGLLYGNRISSS